MTTTESSSNVPANLSEVASFVEQVITLMKQGGITDLQLSQGDFQLSLKAGDHVERAMLQQPSVTAAPTEVDEPIAASDTHTITAPMIGTFYVAPAPGEPPFVRPGDVIEEGQTVGIIEAMKIMNEIAADRAGEIVEVVATDGQTVEYGSPLITIRPQG